MNTTEIVQVLTPLVEALEQLGIPYHIGGSVASSTYGIARPTQDIDVVADVQLQNVRPLVMLLETDYYIDADTIRDAIRHRSSFNIIYFASVAKVDVFIPKASPFARQGQLRAQQEKLEGGDRLFYFASAEDTLLNKLEWYRMGGEVSNRQWNDILGIFKVQGTALDMVYLERWAKHLGVADLLA